jgi:hypothetical protein
VRVDLLRLQPPGSSQQTSYAMNQAERFNLRLVHDFWRDIMLGGNLDIASHWKSRKPG